MSKGLLAQWRRGLLGRGLTGALLLAVPVTTAAVIGFSGGFGSVAGGLDELTTGPDDALTAAPAADDLDAALVSVAGGPDADTPAGGPGDNPADDGPGPGPSPGAPPAPDDGNDTVPNPAPDVPDLPGGGGASDTINDSVDDVVGGVNDTVGGALGGN